ARLGRSRRHADGAADGALAVRDAVGARRPRRGPGCRRHHRRRDAAPLAGAMRLLAGLAFVLILVTALPLNASAHAALVKSSPARGTTLLQHPQRVELVFSERLEPAYSTVEVDDRSEEHTSELQSRGHLVCRLLLEKKKKKDTLRWNNRT